MEVRLSLSLSTSTSPSPSTSLDLCLIHTGIVGVFFGLATARVRVSFWLILRHDGAALQAHELKGCLLHPRHSAARERVSPTAPPFGASLHLFTFQMAREGMTEYAFVFFLLLLFFLTAFWNSLLKCTACSVQLALAIAFHIFVFSSHPTQLSQATGSPSTAFSLPCRRTRQVRLCLRFNKCCSAQLLPSVSEQPHSLWLDFCFDCGSCLIPPPPPPPPPPLSLSLSLSLVCSAVHSTSAATDGVRHVMLLAFRALRACAFALICLPRAPALTLFIGSCFHLHACLACLR